MRASFLILALTVVVGIAAEIIPQAKNCAAVFEGQVVADDLVASETNRVGEARYGLYSITEIRKARIKIESIIKQDRPMTNEVTVYYDLNNSVVCPRPVRLSRGERATFYCVTDRIGSVTNALVIPMGTFITDP